MRSQCEALQSMMKVLKNHYKTAVHLPFYRHSEQDIIAANKLIYVNSPFLQPTEKVCTTGFTSSSPLDPAPLYKLQA